MFYETHDSPIFIRHGRSFDFPPHVHQNLEIMICTEGEYRVSCQFKEACLHRGDVMIAFPHDVHAYSDRSAAKGIIIIVSPDLFPFLQHEIASRRYENFLLDGNETLITIAHALLDEYRSDSNKTIMIGQLYILLGTILKSLPYKEISASIDASHFSKILRYISENYTQKLSLRSVSECFGISACHLSRIFAEHLECTFLSYLHTLRVEHAKNLLRHSSSSILEIAYESGFSDQRTFNRVFKERTALTPKEYRKQKQKA